MADQPTEKPPGWLFSSPTAVREVPSIYFNSFALNLTNADIGAILMLDGAPQAKISMSYTTAKTLNNFLNEIMGQLEKTTGRTIMSTDDVEAGIKKIQADRSK